ncbi:hypothetical protein C3747_1g104 [Trypanosoma cruzi]|uniref:Uncharacterized protein n=2 Tax=Trypanosoma cruzi TaxID=5693 RepID=Q4DLF3_TRYCC|nr:hypothetical protein Tc00.1047053510747.90 [Trypanosoma cruzi]EAN93351.1 hypothetical protein Tc00.1047053510747.90 [Trypanosoma cruzi]PWV21888.1 hypothetical protein C3747_1g104 [Trypanosoma cruzi]|eukprot:XP_815202.1 hypothetical protein [Trypanosoma cruzi strain CL Brener]
MSADGVFLEGSSAPSLELHVGGAPLAEVLADMMRLIRSQQKELESLRRDAEEGIYRNECGLKKHDGVLESFAEDLRIHVRPINYNGQPPMPTMADAVANVECRLWRVERERKFHAAARLSEVTRKKLMAAFYSQWWLLRKLRAKSRFLLTETKREIWRRYMRKWSRSLAFRRRQAAWRRHLMGLTAAHGRRIMMSYWCKWVQVVAFKSQARANRRISAYNISDTMLHITCRGIARRYLYAWAQFVAAARDARCRAQGALWLEQKTARILARRYFERWLDAHRWCRLPLMRLKALDALRAKLSRGLARSFLRAWQDFVRNRCERRRVLRLIPHLHHANLAALARRYFSRLYAFRFVRRDARVVETLEQRLKTLSERADGLQRQLDMGLHTLAHTNSVLARVVDTVMVAGEPRAALQAFLEGDTMMSVPTVPSVEEKGSQQDASAPSLSPNSRRHEETASPTGRERQPTDEHRRVSASEMLQNLRVRLEKTYKMAGGEP